MPAAEAGGEAETEELRRRLVRFGLDVHDGPLQELSALRLDLYLFKVQMEAAFVGDAGPLLGRVADLSARLEETAEELRRLAALAGSASLLTGPFSRVLAELVSGHARGCAVTVHVQPGVDDAAMDDEVRVAALRIVQASIANVGQHSGAVRASVHACVEGPDLKVEVSDDGSGFDVASVSERAAEQGHLGLLGMHERVAVLGGQLSVESVPAKGTCVHVRIPLHGAST